MNARAFIAQLNELGIIKRIKKFFNKFQKGIILKKVGGNALLPPLVGGPVYEKLYQSGKYSCKNETETVHNYKTSYQDSYV